MSEIELLGDAIIDGDRWKSTKYLRSLEVGKWESAYETGVFVNIVENGGFNFSGIGITPDTARSMASALNYYADQADKYKEES